MPRETGNTDYYIRFASSVQYTNWLDHTEKKVHFSFLSPTKIILIGRDCNSAF